MEDNPTARSRELGARLRAVREAAGYPSSNRLAKHLGWSQATVSRLETGMRSPTALNVAAVLEFCKVTGPECAEIMELTECERNGCWAPGRLLESYTSTTFGTLPNKVVLCYVA